MDEESFTKKQIKEASSKQLAGYVVAYRLLGAYKELSKKCMEELLLRKEDGNDFDYEEYINNAVKNAPKSKIMDLTKLKNIIKLSTEE